jgi:hypothetical protein
MYAPERTKATSRQFCSKMVSAKKVYRKEDIVAMENKAVNAGFGKGGSDTYSIWLYKGGARCSQVRDVAINGSERLMYAKMVLKG